MSPVALLVYFFRLGLTGFGGPLAIIGQIQRDLVDEKKIIEKEEFLKSLSLIKSLPGPVATQVVTFCAYRCGGFWFSILAIVLFILPSFIMMLLLAIYYEQFHASPQMVNVLNGMQAGAFILILQALHVLSAGNYRKIYFWILFLLSFVALKFTSLFEPIIIVGAGLAAILWSRIKTQSSLKSFILLDIFWICLKAGGLAFGTGFAILPILQNDFVSAHNWLTREQFMDAIAFGQLTPGPVTITVTFVGYRIAGIWGALLATIGIYLPGIFNMTTWFPRAYEWFSRQSWMRHFVIGATAAIAAGIIVALLSLSQSIVFVQLLVPILLFVLSLRYRIPSWLFVVASGLGWWLLKMF